MRKAAATLCLAGFSSLAGLAAPALAQTPDAAPPAARVIVRFKPESALMRMQAQSADGRDRRHAARAAALGERLGLALRAGAPIGERTQVVAAEGIGAAELAARLRAQGDVEAAEPDLRRRVHAPPVDPYYFSGPPATGPASGQWYLRAPDATVRSSIDVEAAWAVTTGNPSIVVAILDTGVRYDHPDLPTVAAGGSLLPGYDMISDATTANDGDERDGDASDPGDWITSTENGQRGGPFQNCGVSDSSWHGTEMAGLVAAATDNGIGMASVGRRVRVLPVRVLGKCGGFDSDILAGMRWAAGLAVPGVPANPNPARVINLSLGGTGACSDAYREAIAEIRAAGVSVVASAGNSAGHAVSTPANCPGVIAVGGLRHVGTKVGFSDLGPEISLSAPGGNCVTITPGAACQYPILTTTNEGRRAPVAGSAAFSDSYNVSAGTSYAAPLVAATAGLMLSVHGWLGPDDVRARLRQSARPFPTTGGDNGPDPTPVTACTPPQGADQLQCYCTTSTCGAGMLDAGGAVRAALSPLARVTTTPQYAVAGEAVVVSAASSTAAQGRNIVSVRWSLADGGGVVSGFASATDATTATLRPTAPGRFRVALALADDRGTTSSSTQTIEVYAAGQTPDLVALGGGDGGGGGGGALDWHWLAALVGAVAALRRATRGA